ncbi:MAG: hypothetical protein AAGE80_14250 [Pseudomonadota bacterium]
MLTSSQLAIAISAVLACAVAVGWLLHWLWGRVINPRRSEDEQLAEMATRLHTIDQARDQAEEARLSAEAEFSKKERELKAEIDAMRARLEGAVDGREAELSSQLREAKVDAETAMTGLGNARRRISELEAEIEELQEQGGAKTPQ